jgi:hypothetical protein
LATKVATHWTNHWKGFVGEKSLFYPLDVFPADVMISIEPPTMPYAFEHRLEADYHYVIVRLNPTTTITPYNVLMAYTTTEGLTSLSGENDIFLGARRVSDSNIVNGSIGGWIEGGFFEFTSTMIFPEPYQFEWATAIPTDIVTYTLDSAPEPHWVQWNLQQVVSFQGDVFVRDPRIRSDLYVHDLSIEPNPPTAWEPAVVKVVLGNMGPVIPDTYVYTEWYAMPQGAPPPDSPYDHEFGWDDGTPYGNTDFIFDANPASPLYPDPLPTEALGPSDLVTLTRVFVFSEEGPIDLYAQVDIAWTDEHPDGFNQELSEANNIAGPLGIFVLPNDNPPGKVFFPLVMRQ